MYERHGRHRKGHGLGALKAGCEIHVFKDGSRRKVCAKKKLSVAQRDARARKVKATVCKSSAASKMGDAFISWCKSKKLAKRK
jgi:hypothetical protein